MNLNTADRAELAQLPGVGPALAERIVAYRVLHGPFQDPEELEEVTGVGPALVGRLRDVVFVSRTEESGAGPATAMPGLNVPQRPTASRKPQLTRSIDLNRASREQLQQLPGIGPVLSGRILEDRSANGPYARPEDLVRVKGIKGKTLEKLLPFVKTEPVDARVAAKTAG